MKYALSALAMTGLVTVSQPASAQDLGVATIPPGVVATGQRVPGLAPMSCSEHLRYIAAWMAQNPRGEEDQRDGTESLYRQAVGACQSGQVEDAMDMVVGLHRMIALPYNTPVARDALIAAGDEGNVQQTSGR